MRRWLEFLVLSLIALTALGIGAVQAPDRLRSLFPVPLAYGLIAGAALAFLAGLAGVERSRLSLVVAVLLIATGLAGVTLERWRTQVAALKVRRDQELTGDARQQATEAAAQSALARRMLESATPPDDPKARADYDEALREVRKADEDIRSRWSEEGIQRRFEEETRFWRWLNNRELRHGRWEPPWPAVFSMAELCLSAAIGGWLFFRLAAKTAPAAPTEESEGGTSAEFPDGPRGE